MPLNTRLLRALLLAPLLVLAGCASVNGPTEPHDPYEGWNRSVYKFNDAVDKAVARPVAQAYEDYTPHVVNAGISNFFSNLDDVLVLTNDLLQAKFRQAASDGGRLLWNSTVGLFGLIDVATAIDLPKHDEDFGQTLGYWGVEPGPYLILPLVGPSDVRDGIGTVGYWYADPLNEVDDYRTYWAAATVRAVDRRAELLGASRVLEQAALDPYVFTREAYFQMRRSKVYDGKPPKEAQPDPFEEEFDPFAPDATEPSATPQDGQQP
jgi:phospholipid-binding lipoprotein MlaA